MTRNQSKLHPSKTCDAAQSRTESPQLIDIKFKKKFDKSHNRLHNEDLDDTLNMQPYDPEENEQYSKISSIEGTQTQKPTKFYNFLTGGSMMNNNAWADDDFNLQIQRISQPAKSYLAY